MIKMASVASVSDIRIGLYAQPKPTVCLPASLKEVEENDYNLNIPWYIDTV
jgi:hypothetical protein